MRPLFLIISLLFSSLLVAQNFQGKAVYKTSSHTKEKYIQRLEDPNLSIKEKEQIAQSIKILEKMFENSYELIFNDSSSMYKIIEKTALKPAEEFTMPFSSIYFKDFHKRMYYDKKDMGGILFVIHDSLPTYNWQLTNETKKIGKYTCYRAFYKDSIMSPKRINHKDGGFEMVEAYKDILTEAWYAPEIPISNGPHRFGGLPGLILEITLYGGQTTLLCVEIELNQDQIKKIVFPTNKKTLTEAEYAELTKEKD